MAVDDPLAFHGDLILRTRVAAGRLRAEMEGVTLWEGITSALARANDIRLRLEVSLRRLSSLT
jgi:hypothetical protein